MATFIMLSRLSPEGMKTLRENASESLCSRKPAFPKMPRVLVFSERRTQFRLVASC